jgi:hypothetical protein
MPTARFGSEAMPIGDKIFVIEGKSDVGPCHGAEYFILLIVRVTDPLPEILAPVIVRLFSLGGFFLFI